MKKIGKIFLAVILSLLAILVIGALIVFASSPGKLPALTDAEGTVIDGSISEKGWAKIGGIQQGFFIRSEKASNPVVLFLHGGPGSPELSFIMANETTERVEKYFTVCYWDQRGAGMTYSRDENPANMTVERMVEDTREITQYLIQRFGVQKIYLMGHSWGSYLGIKTIEKYPELYAAYIGIGQVTNQLESERLAYDYMLTHARLIGDTAAIKKLDGFDKNAADFPSNAYLEQARTPLMNKYGIGIEHKNFSMLAMIRDLVFFRGYTFANKLNYFAGTAFSLINVFHYVTSDNLFVSSPTFAVPVYIVQGKYDYQVSHSLAEQYAEAITAPAKAFYTFEHSAHSPNSEEPERFVSILQEIAATHPVL